MLLSNISHEHATTARWCNQDMSPRGCESNRDITITLASAPIAVRISHTSCVLWNAIHSVSLSKYRVMELKWSSYPWGNPWYRLWDIRDQVLTFTRESHGLRTTFRGPGNWPVAQIATLDQSWPSSGMRCTNLVRETIPQIQKCIQSNQVINRLVTLTYLPVRPPIRSATKSHCMNRQTRFADATKWIWNVCIDLL